MKPPPNEEALFLAAAPLPTADRAAFLDRECACDPALRARLDTLLAAHDEPDTLPSPEALVSPTAIARALPQDPTADNAVGLTRGRYKLLERLGEGGCGVVYVAEQSEPVRRRVALKLIKPGMDSKAVIARFEAERQALALMDHPNIAKVLDGGTTDSGRPFFVMELVRGIRITEYCDQEKLPVRDRLDLFIKVCQAIQHAHQKGIIHRDIKPSNILVTLHDGVPVPKVIDFGIAKAVEGRLTDATVYTQLHQFIGTPAYMSPEQAEMSGLDIDTRSDIYSLGVLLYELLTGVTPFDAKELVSQGLDAMRRTIREKEPVRPSTRLTQLQATRAGTPLALRHSRFATDLDWIVMKCLEKDRARRYETANGLAADLKRHLSNEPIVARPPNAGYRFQKAWGRNKLAFSAAAAMAVVLIAGIGISTSQAIRALRAERKARLSEQEERQQAEQARLARDRATQAEAEALAHLRDARRSTYVSEMSVAFSALAENNLGRVRELLDRQRPTGGEEDLRGFEWRYLWQLARGEEFATFEDQVAMTADFSPDGRYFAYGDSRVIVRESDTLKTIATLEVGALTLRFAPRSHWLVSAQNQVIIWDTDRWQPLRTFPEAGHTALFSPNERWFVAGIPGGYRVWDTTTWKPVGDCTGAPVHRWHGRHALVFSPDSESLITHAGEGYPLGDHLRVWQLPTLEEREPVRVGDGEIGAVTFSPDGKKLATGLFDGRAVIWDFATRRALKTNLQHTAWIPVVMSAKDGRTFFSASADRTLIVWDWDTGEPRIRLRGHTGELWSAAFSPDGRQAVSGSNDGTTKVWVTDPISKEAALEGQNLAGPNLVAGFSDGGRRLIAVSTNAFVMWDPVSGMRADTPLPPIQAPVLTGDWGRPYAVQPTELVGVRGCGDGTVEAWDLKTGIRKAQWRAHEQRVGTLAFSADGRLLATGGKSGEVKVWDFAGRQELVQLGPVDAPVLCVAFSPDGGFLAASTASDSVWVWSLESRQGIRLGGNPGPVWSVAFSPDGTCLANTTMAANEVRFWQLPSGRPLAPLRGHLEGVTSVAFSPDGKTVATGCADRRVTLWNFATRQEMTKIRPGVAVPMVNFSPDGHWLTVGDLADKGRQIRTLRAPSFAEIDLAEKSRMARTTPP